MTTASNLREPLPLEGLVLDQFRQVVGERFVLSSPEERLVYDCDGCVLLKALPQAIILPKTTEEVSAVVKICHTHNIPFVARGAGTGLSGGALATEGGIIIALNRMDTIIEIDPVSRTATVEVGVVNAWLNREARQYGLFYAPDPSSQSACTLGGNIAENAGGIHCLKYGVTVDHILGLELVLPDGDVLWVGSQTRRIDGLNFLGTIIGSEGTFGIVTRTVVQLLPIPVHIHTMLLAFDDTAAACRCISALIQKGIIPAALEFMDAFTVNAVNQAFSVGFPDSAEAVLLIELDDKTSLGLETSLEELLSVVTPFKPSQIKHAKTEEERTQLWKARKGAVAAYGRYLPAFYLHDCVIPRRHLATVLAQIIAIGQKHDVLIGNVFHAGDGNLHPNILFDPDDQAMMTRVLKAGEEILDACLAVGGVLSGEHGIGIEKSAYMSRLFTPEDLARMAGLKRLFDPKNLANPEKILPHRSSCGENNTATSISHPLFTQHGAWI